MIKDIPENKQHVSATLKLLLLANFQQEVTLHVFVL